MKPLFKRKRIFSQLLIMFLPLVIFSLGAGTYLNYMQARHSLQHVILGSLQTIAKRHSRQIETYIRERQRDLRLLSQSNQVQNALSFLGGAALAYSRDSAEFRQWDDSVPPFFSAYQDIYQYEDLYLISLEGDVLYSVKKRGDLGTNLKTGPLKESQLAHVFVRAVSLLETEISDFDYYEPLQGPAGFIAAPVFDGMRFIGVIALQINNHELYRIVNDYTGLGRTGESLVGIPKGSGVLLVSPTRFDTEAAFKRTISFNSDVGYSMQQAISKQNGQGLTRDYRGQEVLAVWGYLPSVRWGLVVKMDTAEAFAPIMEVRDTALLLAVLFVGLSVTVILLAARDLTRPIDHLTQVTRKVAQGDLEQRVEVSANNEFLELADSFNAMTQRLREMVSRLETANQELNLNAKRMEKVNHDLKRSNEDLDKFASVAAHDLQEPLRKIIFFGEMLGKKIPSRNSEVQPLLTKMESAASRMGRLLQDLLEFARPATVRRPMIAVSLGSLVKSVVEDLEARIQQTGGQVDCQPLPVAKVDVFQMKQVFQNLISNGLKFYKKNEPPVISIYSRPGPQGTDLVVVEDQGIGIQPEYFERVFYPFERLNSRSEYEGTGLGLSICRKIVLWHEGDIWVESVPGQGSRFILQLPVHQSLPESPAELRDQPAASA